MTSKFLMTTATVAALVTGGMAYADAHTAGFMADHAMSTSDDAKAMMDAAVGIPVTLVDGTQIGVLESYEMETAGSAKLSIDTTGFDGVVNDGATLILTASAEDVSVTEAAVSVNVDGDRLKNNIAADSPDTGDTVKATVVN